jgi:hypothetical protein
VVGVLAAVHGCGEDHFHLDPLRGLARTPGASPRDWLALRRQRALLGLRLAGARSAWSATWAVAVLLLMLVGGLEWASRKAARKKAGLVDVDALAREWLDEPPTT